MIPNTNIYLPPGTNSANYYGPYSPYSGTLKVGVTLPVEAAKAVEHAKREPEQDKIVEEITLQVTEEKALKNKTYNLNIKYFSAGISIGFAIGLLIGCYVGLAL